MKLYYLLSLLLAAAGLMGNSPVEAADCYNSTYAIVVAQTQGMKEFILCPDTTIDIGLPANAEFTEFMGGDFPLSIISDNVTIQCGEDGSSMNNCVLNGGFIQMVATPANPLFPGVITTNNLMVKGLTFSGTLTGVSGILSSSIAVGTAGMDMVFDDCIFTGLTADIVIFMGKDALSPPDALLPFQSSLSISNSVFKDITYTRGILQAENQTMDVKGTTFDDLKYSECGCNFTSVINLYDAKMDLSDSSFNNVEFLTGVVEANGNNAGFTYSGLTGSGLVVYEQESRSEDNYCEGGLVIDKVVNGMLDSCMDLFGDESDEVDPGDDTSASMSLRASAWLLAVAVFAGVRMAL